MADDPRTYDVLVVDDDFMVADIHTRFIEATPGFRAVGTAHTAAVAIRSIRNTAPDLVLLDVYLPDMSGLEALTNLRAEGNDVAVIVITAARELDTVRRALQGGASDYLIKPFEYRQLLEKLENFRRRAKALAETGSTSQSVVDSLFGAGRPPTDPAELPKGLSAGTAQLVLHTVRANGELSASECAAASGLSRVSVRRYLEHFAAAGELVVRLEYGRAGRPVHRYRADD